MFYEQYLTIQYDTVVNLVSVIFAVFAVSIVLLGFDLWTSLIIVFVIIMILISMMGMMYLWDISLNAISLVNLVMVCRHHMMPSLYFPVLACLCYLLVDNR